MLQKESHNAEEAANRLSFSEPMAKLIKLLESDYLNQLKYTELLSKISETSKKV